MSLKLDNALLPTWIGHLNKFLNTGTSPYINQDLIIMSLQRLDFELILS